MKADKKRHNIDDVLIILRRVKDGGRSEPIICPYCGKDNAPYLQGKFEKDDQVPAHCPRCGSLYIN